MASALGREGALPSLHTLNLSENDIGAAGASALASALGRDGVLPSLHTLNPCINDIGIEGVSALVAALGRDGALPLGDAEGGWEEERDVGGGEVS